MALFQKVHLERSITVLLVTHTNRFVTYGTHSLQMAGGAIANGRI